jgi:outer membrane lipoprotein SlyB
MSNEATSALRRIHPLTAIAAVSITALSLTGVAAMTGLIGGSRAEPAAAAHSVTAAALANPVSATMAAAPASAAPASAAPASAAPASAAPASAASIPTAAAVHAPPTAATRATPASAAPAPVKQAVKAPVKQATPAQAAVDPTMGTVVSIDRVDISSANNGIGAVAGAVVGGVAGHQIGGGRGKDVATVLGAVGGAVAGNAIEKYERKSYRYDVLVHAADGSTRTLHYSSPPSFGVGERISLKSSG